MAQSVQPIDTSMTVKQKLSVTVGVLSAIAFLISKFSVTWGFQEVASQIVETILAVVSCLSIYFGCSTIQKNQDEKESNGKV